jgi:hypothetical protein
MSRENVEAFLRGSVAANSRDIEALLALLDPEVEWHPAMAEVLGGEATVYRGHEGVRAWLRDQQDSFVGVELESPVGWVVEFKTRQSDPREGIPRPRRGPRSRRAERVTLACRVTSAASRY